MRKRCIPRQRFDCPEQNAVAADVSALLDSAAAEVVPRFEEPKKMWPSPFEIAGGSYVYASEYGLYWDPDSMFYYDAQTKVYHNSFTGVYYRCVNPGESGGAAFQLFAPPPPVDDAVFQESTAKMTTNAKPALSLSLKKDKKKAPGIAFGIKTAAFASTPSAFGSRTQTKPAGKVVAPNSASIVNTSSVGMKRKSADDIAKWSQRQREAKSQEQEPVSDEHHEAAHSTPTAISDMATKTDATSSTNVAAGAPVNAADSVINALTNVPQEVPICLAKENKQHIAAQYREREKAMERDAKKQRQEERAPSNAQPGNNQRQAPASSTNSEAESAVNSLESGIGGKMLKMMGWKSGEGLGKHGTGITAPIKAAGQGGRSDTAGLGLKAPFSASVDLSDVTSDKERRQRLARARYEAENA
ncbi:unnamed protein product [Phytophthora lilii]|uniref:Unnamed protein product n=1 Tax=Phytophthora lilii TaxID=2077276 RepID=A0A9W6WFS3_9STRA|nr:unnamed protein product [Phytophthora lilii]